MPVVTRTEEDYRQQILELQARLHSANVQIVQKNSDLVNAENVNSRLQSDLKEQAKTLNKFRNENYRLERRVASNHNLPEGPRPGPALKPWKDLAPRSMNKVTDPIQEVLLKTSVTRQVDPVMLTGEVLFR